MTAAPAVEQQNVWLTTKLARVSNPRQQEITVKPKFYLRNSSAFLKAEPLLSCYGSVKAVRVPLDWGNEDG